MKKSETQNKIDSLNLRLPEGWFLLPDQITGKKYAICEGSYIADWRQKSNYMNFEHLHIWLDGYFTDAN